MRIIYEGILDKTRCTYDETKEAPRQPFGCRGTVVDATRYTPVSGLKAKKERFSGLCFAESCAAWIRRVEQFLSVRSYGWYRYGNDRLANDRGSFVSFCFFLSPEQFATVDREQRGGASNPNATRRWSLTVISTPATTPDTYSICTALKQW